MKRQRLVVENGNQPLWLVKLPPEIANQWKNMKDDEIIGSFVVANVMEKSGLKKQPQMHLKSNGNSSSSSQPSIEVYSLEETQSGNQQAFAFSEISTDAAMEVDEKPLQQQKGSKFEVNGRITKRLSMKVVGASIRRDNERRVNQVTRINTEAMLYHTIDPSTSHKVKTEEQEKADSLPADRKTVQREVLAAFGQSIKLELHELKRIVKQKVGNVADKDVRDVVGQFASYQARGVDRGLWILKPEFRTAVPPPQQSSSIK